MPKYKLQRTFQLEQQRKRNSKKQTLNQQNEKNKYNSHDHQCCFFLYAQAVYTGAKKLWHIKSHYNSTESFPIFNHFFQSTQKPNQTVTQADIIGKEKTT